MGDTRTRYTRETVREFVPGKYLLYSPAPQVNIVHHEKVSPVKIADYLLHSDTGVKYKLGNYINSHDWMHYCNWAIINKQLCDMNRLKQFKWQVAEKNWAQCFFMKAEFDVSKSFSVIKGQLVSDSDETVFGYIFNVPQETEWIYGCLFEDKSSEKCFAFVMEDMYTGKNRMYNVPDLVHCCEKDQYKFKMRDFY